MKVICISGFLGAGKTTFIENMLEVLSGDVNSVVLENEYANTDIDEKQLEKKAKVYQLAEGCICCSKRTGFAETVMTIANTVNPDLLIVEPTGVGRLSQVLENIGKVEYFRIVQLEALTVVDPVAMDYYLTQYGPLFEDQIANSGTVYLAVRKGTDPAVIEEAKEKIKAINKDAAIVEKPLEHLSREFFMELLKKKRKKGVIEVAGNHGLIDSYGIDNVYFSHGSVLNMKMRAVMEGRFGKVLRVKGTVNLQGSICKIDVAGMQLTVDEIADRGRDATMVIIGEHLDKESLQLLFKSN